MFFKNLPLLVQKKRDSSQDDKGLKIVHPVTFQDIRNTDTKEEMVKMVNDPFATDYTLDHLEKKFGAIKNLFFINYNLNSFIEYRIATRKSIKNDELAAF